MISERVQSSLLAETSDWKRGFFPSEVSKARGESGVGEERGLKRKFSTGREKEDVKRGFFSCWFRSPLVYGRVGRVCKRRTDES